MMLVEQTMIASSALPVWAFKEHLRLGTGFSDDDVQESVLGAYLRAAIAAIEARTSKATLSRTFRWSVPAWRDLASQTLPIAPVAAITALTIVDRQGGEEPIDESRFTLATDTHRPRLVSTGFLLPPIPVGGKAMIDFDAGYGASWDAIPPDLAQAVFLLATQYYEDRSAVDTSGIPSAVNALIARYRDVRLFGGGRA
ncbi:hypothetical protein [Maritimibacter sp. UBA3975]|uniref:head-tail connector protein n=1 Tax=Maritimibacter sp. UBA3975 TaxID=1946833 RepID=UPI000C09B716|nr:hypothetical protein [Maritimibacter sp. UBA3975]MAM61056.1 hypothetical protein [Maritimibacter sp.]|tara:strand:- start:5523 stop:6116 length:594 start_codon:yes stop_codon:yes gene_type:complete